MVVGLSLKIGLVSLICFVTLAQIISGSQNLSIEFLVFGTIGGKINAFEYFYFKALFSLVL